MYEFYILHLPRPCSKCTKKRTLTCDYLKSKTFCPQDYLSWTVGYGPQQREEMNTRVDFDEWVSCPPLPRRAFTVLSFLSSFHFSHMKFPSLYGGLWDGQQGSLWCTRESAGCLNAVYSNPPLHQQLCAPGWVLFSMGTDLVIPKDAVA